MAIDTLMAFVLAGSDMGAKVEQAMKRASGLQQKKLQADTAEIERDAASATDRSS